MMSLNELDTFVTKIETLRQGGKDMIEQIHQMERNKIASKMADAIIDWEAKITYNMKKNSPSSSPNRSEQHTSLTQSNANNVKLINQNIIKDGMIPKVKTAIDAIEKGVRAVVILDGSIQNACLLELFTDHGVGTLIREEID